MNREEFIAKLQMVYVGDRNAFDEIVGVYDDLKEENQRLKKDYETIVSDNCDYLLLEKENQRLNNVLNELEKWVYQFREEHKNDTGIFDKFLTTREVLYKLNELKESDK